MAPRRGALWSWTVYTPRHGEVLRGLCQFSPSYWSCDLNTGVKVLKSQDTILTTSLANYRLVFGIMETSTICYLRLRRDKNPSFVNTFTIFPKTRENMLYLNICMRSFSLPGQCQVVNVLLLCFQTRLLSKFAYVVSRFIHACNCSVKIMFLFFSLFRHACSRSVNRPTNTARVGVCADQS